MFLPEDLNVQSPYRYCDNYILHSSRTTKAHYRAPQPQSSRQTRSIQHLIFLTHLQVFRVHISSYSHV